MRLILDSLLPLDEAQLWCQRLLAPQTAWDGGQDTAGWHARTVKRNRQLPPAEPLHRELCDTVRSRLLADRLLQSAALPVALHDLRVSRCGVGEGYGRHVDNAFMAGGRSDLSFTLFLSEPASYGGGALVLAPLASLAALSEPASRSVEGGDGSEGLRPSAEPPPPSAASLPSALLFPASPTSPDAPPSVLPSPAPAVPPVAAA